MWKILGVDNLKFEFGEFSVTANMPPHQRLRTLEIRVDIPYMGGEVDRFYKRLDGIFRKSKMNCEIATCGKEINYDGALLFSPPNDTGLVKKIHICKECYLYIYYEYIKSIKNPPLRYNDHHINLVCKNFKAEFK